MTTEHDLQRFADDVGEEVFGMAWLAYAPLVRAWMRREPERLAWLLHRIKKAIREGRL